MNDLRITEADVGKKFRLRNGDVVTVTKIFDHGSFPVKGKMGQYWFLDGTYYEDVEGAYNLDIVERFPEEGGGYKDGDCVTHIKASNGEIYPVQYWTTQQRFEDVTPPYMLDIVIQGDDLGHLEWMKGVAGKYDIELHRQDLIDRSATWTLAPLPHKLKEEVNVWDKYISDYGTFSATGIKMTAGFVKTHSQKIDALYAWKNHVISQDEA